MQREPWDLESQWLWNERVEQASSLLELPCPFQQTLPQTLEAVTWVRTGIKKKSGLRAVGELVLCSLNVCLTRTLSVCKRETPALHATMSLTLVQRRDPRQLPELGGEPMVISGSGLVPHPAWPHIFQAFTWFCVSKEGHTSAMGGSPSVILCLCFSFQAVVVNLFCWPLCESLDRMKPFISLEKGREGLGVNPPAYSSSCVCLSGFRKG